jgi:hypothetical protein
MDNESKNQLTDRVQDATAKTLQDLACPACGGSLHVQFVPKGRRGKGAGSLYVMCGQCMWRVIRDGIPTEPPWVRVLGPKMQTLEGQVSPQPQK